MRKLLSSLLAFSLVLTALVMTQHVASAAETTTQHGIEATIVTDQEEYSSGEEIQVTLNISNRTADDISKLQGSILLPEDLILLDGETSLTDVTIAGLDTYTQTLIVEKKETVPPSAQPTPSPAPTTAPGTGGNGDTSGGSSEVPDSGDHANLGLWVALFFIAVVALALALRFKRGGWKALSLLLCAAVLCSALPMQGLAAEHNGDTATLSLEKTITVDGDSYTIQANLTFPVSQPQPDPTGSHTVTFVLNDGSAGAYDIQTVGTNDLVAEPVAPTKDNFAFTGWYTDPSGVNLYDFQTPVTQDMTLYAGWGSPLSQEGVYGVSSDLGTACSITGLELVEDTAHVTINVNDTSVLVVRVLDETTEELLYETSVQTPAYGELVSVSVPIAYDLPQYFVVTANLYDSNAQALCDTYRCIKYTSVYEEFDQLTIADFSDQTVLNFDADTTDNFAVLNDNVIVIPQTPDTNVMETLEMPLTDDTVVPEQKYQFTHADATVTSLTVGDAVLAMDTIGQYQLFKIADITVEGGTYTFTPDQKAQITEFYDMLKVDLDQDRVQPAATASATPYTANSRDINVIDVDTTRSADLSTSLQFTPVDWLSITGSLTGSAEVDIEMVYDVSIFGPDYFSCSLVSNVELEFNVEVSASVNNDDKVKEELELAKVRVPTPVPGLNVYVAETVPFEWSVSGTVSFTYTNSTKSGFVFDSSSGYQPIESKETSFNLDVQAKGEIKFGPKTQVGVEFCGDVVDANLGVQVGVKGTLEAGGGLEGTNAESKHACTLCISGECNWFVEATAQITVTLGKFVEWTPVDATLFSLEGPVKFGGYDAIFYCSVINSEDSMFGGHITLGGGECPNVTWRTTMETKDIQGNVVSGVDIVIQKDNAWVTTLSSGEDAYLYDGIYTATATIGGVRVNSPFVVSEAAQTVVVSPNSTNTKLSGKVCDSSTGAGIEGATILIKRGDLVISSLYSDANGSYTVNVPAGTYSIKITNAGYIPFSSYETVSDGQTLYLQTSLMVNGSAQLMGGFSGTITDATTGNPVGNVTLELREGWNNTGYSDVIATYTTNSRGYFESDVYEIFGVVFGLSSGNYTLNTSKDGYVSKSFNVVVLPGVVTGNQNTSISPAAASGDFRVVLRWGSQQPPDLDAHYNARMSNGARDHVYYANMQGYTAFLDVDDTSYEGPETITVTDFDALQDGFVYSVYNFSNGSSTYSTVLSQSEAYVQVYRGDTLLRTYYVPTDQEGTAWNVFSVDAQGELHDINTFEYIDASSDVGADLISNP